MMINNSLFILMIIDHVPPPPDPDDHDHVPPHPDDNDPHRDSDLKRPVLCPFLHIRHHWQPKR